MLLLDSFLRFPTVVGLLFFAGLLLRDQNWTLRTWVGALLAISLGALFLTNAPAVLALPHPLWVFAKVLAAPNLALLWWFGRSLLDDNFRLRALEWIGFFLLSIGNLPLLPDQASAFATWSGVAFNPLAFAVPIHLAFLAIVGWRNDLIEKRRNLRLFLLCWMILSLPIILLVEDADTPGHIEAFTRMALTMPAIWLVIMTSIQIQPNLALLGPHNKNLRGKLDPSEQTAAVARLMQAIEAEQLFLDPTLTLPVLSKHCGMTQYKMRNLINGELGFANFSTFLNAYRVEEAKQRLAQSNEPITTIALDCGFKSLSTFNRVFKKFEGLTPTLYREQPPT